MYGSGYVATLHRDGGRIISLRRGSGIDPCRDDSIVRAGRRTK